MLAFPNRGFLGTGATFAADVNLLVQLLMGSTLIVGMVLARRKRYKAHGICQTTVLLLNLIMISLIMWPSFRQQLTPSLSRMVHKWYHLVALIHAALGVTAEVLGLYIVILAGTDILPKRLRIGRWKVLMRTELALWWLVLLIGVETYYTWYIAPFR